MNKIKAFFINLKNNLYSFFYKNKYGTVMLIVGLIVVFGDLFLKYFTDGTKESLISGFISIFSTHNPGAAWSIFSNNTAFLIVISCVFIIGILIFNWFYKGKSYFYAISLGLVISGALCNLVDRIRFGYVRDFIKLEFINFPVFNIADCAITVGIILLCVHFIFLADKNKTKNNKDEEINGDTKE